MAARAGGPLRLGLIGAGRWGKNYIRTLAGLPDVVLARLGSRNPAAPGLCGKDCVVSADWREVAAAGDLDGVIIAAPARLHAEMAAAAIAAGLPVMVEKPLTLDLGQARGLLALAEERGATVLVDHTHLFHPGYPRLKQSVRELGPLRSIASSGGQWGPFDPEKPPLWEYGAHDVALCMDLLGESPRAVSARREESRATPEGRGEVFRLTLGFSGGVEADVRVGNLFAEKTRSITLAFDGRSMTLDDVNPPTLSRGPGGEALPVPQGRPLTRAVEAFLAAVRAGSRDRSSLALGVAVVDVLARCQRDAGP